MKFFFLFLPWVLFLHPATAQNYTSYFTGDTADVQPTPQRGLVLMGGATEHDSAMVWFLNRSGGGDIVVLRASGSNGYNDYFYEDLGVSVNSVETIVCHNAAASFDPYVIQRVRQAEALWFAGGDQGDYFLYWNNTPLDTVINDLIRSKGIPVGGTSAGMAILGDVVFTAANGTVTSAMALANPYHPKVTLEKGEFLHHPWLHNLVTDTHYDNPDRRGRHVAFLARIATDYGVPALGIGCNEYTAVCVDSTGLARVYGDFPAYPEFAYFLRSTCAEPATPEVCVPNQPLTWDRGHQAVKVYKVPGTNTGAHTFQLSDWTTGSGGNWEDWYVTDGTLYTVPNADPAACSLSTSLVQPIKSQQNILLFPNPATDRLTVTLESPDHLQRIAVFNVAGVKVLDLAVETGHLEIPIAGWSNGVYILQVTASGRVYSRIWAKN